MWKKSERHKYFTQQATRLSRKKYSLQSGSMWVLLGHQSEDNQSLLDKRCNQKERHIKSKNSHRISGLSPCGALHCSPLLPSVHLHLNYEQQIHSNLFVNLSCTPQWNLNENSLDYRNPANVHVQVIRVGLYREQFWSVKVLHKETALKGIPAFRNVSGSTSKLCHIKHALQSSLK